MKKCWLVKKLNKKYFLKVGNKTFGCQLGLGGLNYPSKKIEDDKTTPMGKWYIVSLYYRSDRVLRPKFKNKNVLKINRITKDCGWCDDNRSLNYNKHVKITNFPSLNFNYERLWREDNVYDLIIVISHNIKPIIKNKGSAIFIHCSFSDKRNTMGCIALKKKDILTLLKNLTANTFIKI